MRPGPIRSSAWEIATVLSALEECPPAAMRWPLAGLLLALLLGGPSAPAQPLAAATGRGPPREPCGRTAAGVSAVPAVCGWSMAGSGRAPRWAVLRSGAWLSSGRFPGTGAGNSGPKSCQESAW